MCGVLTRNFEFAKKKLKINKARQFSKPEQSDLVSKSSWLKEIFVSEYDDGEVSTISREYFGGRNKV